MALLVGCAKPAAETGPVVIPVIRTISVDSDVALVRHPFVKLPDDVWVGDFLGGQTSEDGGSFTSNHDQTSVLLRLETDETRKIQKLKETKYKDFLAHNGIDMKKIVFKSMTTGLSQEGTGLKVSDQGADARMALNISFYGIHESYPLSGLLKPILVVEAELFVKGNTRVWKGRESIQTANDLLAPPHTMAELEKDPKLLGTMYENMAQVATARLLLKLKADLPVAPK